MDPYVNSDRLQRLLRTTPYYSRVSRSCMYRSKQECPRGVDCGLHGNPCKARENLLNIIKKKEDHVYYKNLHWPVLMKSPSLGPPHDDSIRTIYVSGIDQRINEQDLRVNFFAHGEIESLKLVIARKFALVTYKTREGAVKAGEELSKNLGIKGLLLELMRYRPPAPKPECVASDEAMQQAVGGRSGLLPVPVILQQKYHVPQPSGFKDLAPLELQPPQQRDYYPSLDPQRTGAIISSPESSCGSNDN
ncbi:zinc finger CCCH domain-containing protein 40-like [Apium graveolens]|uniref:zinc finger CCCH domain-containing protein 40-like n=1 Tax=Apium graveolens TaxID=4045 RepID=UPI003D7A05BF